MKSLPNITELRFEREFSRLREQVRASVSPFGDRSPVGKAERRERASGDFSFFCETYLPHYFDCPPADFHREVIGLAQWRPDPRKGEVLTPVVVAAPRGFAKSTLFSFAFPLWQALFERRHFIIIGSETKTLAADHVASLAAELAENPRITYDFGQQLAYAPKQPDIVLACGCRILGRGAGQQMRGLKHRQHRPDLAVLDDIENDQGVRSPEQVKKVLNWVISTVYPALDPEGSLFIIGTLLSKKSALATMLLSLEPPYPQWTRRLFRAIQDDGTSLWPAKHPLAILEATRERMGLAAFLKEKQNDPPDDSEFFQLEWIRRYEFDQVPEGLVVVGHYDPSTGAGDFGAIITVGLDPREMNYYVLDAYIRKVSVTEALKAALLRQQTTPYFRFGMETNGFQALALQILPELEREAGVTLPVVEIKSTTNKALRIESLSPLVQRGKLLFNLTQGDQRLLVQQLLSFPQGHDDGPDALEGAISLLRQGRPSSAGILAVAGGR